MTTATLAPKKGLRHYYGGSLLVTVIGLAVVGALTALKVGTLTAVAGAVAITFLLAGLETTLSFDNAVINAGILRKLDDKWRHRFLTWGILIAVVGMRLYFPIAIVQFTAHLGFFEVGKLAVNDPHQYGEYLEHAHPLIAMFAGMYLLQIGLDFFFTERDTVWLRPVERALGKIGRMDNVGLLVAVIVYAAICMNYHERSLWVPGIFAIGIYQGVSMVSSHFENKNEEEEAAEDEARKEAEAAGRKYSIKKLSGKAAFFMFLYLELQDASFSFDGVSGAFAITPNVLYITVGLAIGAMFVRSMSIHFVETDKLEEFDYLEHGAYWAIMALSVLILISLGTDLGEVIPGVVTFGIVVASLLWSKYFPAPEEDNDGEPNGFDEDTGTKELIPDKA